MVWIRSANPQTEPCDWIVVANKFEASVLTEHQAQQIAHMANEREHQYSWEHLPWAGGYIVEGK